MTDKPKDFSIYGQSADGHFSVIDTLPVPHPYCLTPKHVAYASDHCGGMLGEAAIEGAEQAGARCDICKKTKQTLSYKEHGQALLIECRAPLKEGDQMNAELHAWLLTIKELAEQQHMMGFAFKEAKPED